MESDSKKIHRVRFAPSPTGWMHLGNVRAALFNKLYAIKNNGVFVLRIEDTDTARNVDPGAKKIQEDLKWLGLPFDEGPFFQSERAAIYQKYLEYLIAQDLVYRCFDSAEELEKRRQIQLARGLPPKYDRACLALSEAEIAQKLANNTPFIWRLKMPNRSIQLPEVTRGQITFDLSNFSDFALTRQDGSFTFLFANFVDDVEMGITMIIRGEDHLSNSASQAALYYACNKPIPSFFHLPLICSATGKKLSKRDFGFSLSDLQNAGYLPQAIVNYIGLLGHSFTQEIMDLETLAQAIPFNEQSPKNSVRYDVEKLRWINHAWIQKVSIEELAKHVTPFLQKTTMACSDYMEKHLPRILEIIRPNLQTLADVPALIDFITNPPTSYDPTMLAQHNAQALAPLLQTLATAQSTEQFMEQIKILPSKEEKKNFFVLIRLAITGQPQGLGIKELMQLMPYNEIQNRIRHLHKSITD